MENNVIEKAKKMINIFSASTGLEGRLIDARGKTLYASIDKSKECLICDKIDSKKCMESHLFGAYQAELYGGTYIFFCPIGLVHFASPIIVQQEMVGALLGGHLLMVPPDQILYEELLHYLPNEKEVKDSLSNIDVIEPRKVKALSEMLQVFAEQISDETIKSLHNKQEDYKFNQELSQYIQDLKSCGNSEKLNLSYPVEKEKELLHYVSVGDRKKAAGLLDSILVEVIYLSGTNISLLKARILEIIVLLSRTIIETGGKLQEILGYNYLYLNQVNSFDKIDELLRWTNRVLIRFMDCVFDLSEAKHIHAIHKTIHYIYNNYMNKIALQDVAKHVNFTPQYFSKIFKEETKYSFKKFLNKVRIEKSMVLLRDDELTQSEIAYLVGFSDQSHFSRSFKQITGISPTDYKKQHI